MNELTLETLAKRLDALERQVNRLLPLEDADPPGTSGDEQSDDPEAVARWIAAFDAIPPVTMTADEETAWQNARAKQKQTDTVGFNQLAADLQGTE